MPKVNPDDVLRSEPKFSRSQITRGLKESQQPRVERDGGDYGAGLIRKASLIARGEALGHGMWIDDEMLNQVAEHANSLKTGLKVRFTHPGLSSDGLGTLTARAKAVEVIDGATIGDLHIVQSAHKTPDGDLAEYVMDLAESDPDMFGMSIVYSPDFKAEREHERDHTEFDEDGRGEFVSPDPANESNLPHARLSKLYAADVVDEPAANPNGLFYREQSLAKDADALVSYALGLSTERPAMVSLSIDPDRVSQFVGRFLDNHGLQITSKEDPMADTEKNQDADKKPENDQPTTETETKPEESGTPEEKPAGDGELSARAREGKAFIEAFGEEDGSKYFANGLSFEQAQVQFTKKLREENEQLRQRLSARRADGVEEPIEFSSDEDKRQQKKGLESVIRRANR
ncbi:MAG: hypothetical protein KDI37_03610 [Xanthomonadales bacterium]|nr:hypothetical protein [Xanthomonadales bacterium]